MELPLPLQVLKNIPLQLKKNCFDLKYLLSVPVLCITANKQERFNDEITQDDSIKVKTGSGSWKSRL